MFAQHCEKFSIPQIDIAILLRSSLISNIERRSVNGILYIHAPAGYGKTSATVQWLLSKKYKAAWFSLDVFDSNDSDFYKGILLALFAFSNENSIIKNIIEDNNFDNTPLEHMLDTLSKLELTTFPNALIIDNFQLCKSKNIRKSLLDIRNRFPMKTRFIVISRTPPGNELYEPIIKGLLKQITIKELQFSEKEVMGLFRQKKLTLSIYQFEMIQKQTLGWPAAISALIISADNNKLFLNSKIIDNYYLKGYIKNLIYENSNLQNVSNLMKIAVCDYFDYELCEMITGEKSVWKTLMSLSQRTGLIMKSTSGTYEYHKVLRDFLLAELESDVNIDKCKLYSKIAVKYKNNNNLVLALTMAVKGKNISLIEDIQRIKDAYGEIFIGVKNYVEAVNVNILNKVPNELICKSISLSLDCFVACYALGQLDEAYKWSEIIKKHLASEELIPKHYAVRGTLQFAILPKEDSWNVVEVFRRISHSITNICPSKTMSAFSLTFNLPFFHKAQRDYADISLNLDNYLTAAKKQLTPFFGSFYEQLNLLLEAGICFEMNDLKKAKKICEYVVKIAENSTPEIRFSIFMLLSEIYWCEGNKSKLKDTLKETEKMIADTSSSYLTANFNAFITNQLIQEGDIDSARQWLEYHSDFDKLPLKFYECFQNLTTAKALIVTNKLNNAIELLDKICEFSVLYRRNIDLIEVYALRSICYHRMKNNECVIENITKAILKAQEFQISMPIIKEGADIVPILQKVLNRIKLDIDSENLDKFFINNIYLHARKMSELYGGFFTRVPVKPVKLSEKQALILNFLSQKMTYKEMCEATGTKISTIRDHVSKLYEKLGASNSTEALLKAMDLGILTNS